MSATAPQLIAALRAQFDLQPGEQLYGVVDAAQDASLVLEAERRCGGALRMLFRGEAAPYMKEFAPYLVPVDPAGDYLECWAARWGKSVGVFLTTAVEPEHLLLHLRQIFVVQDESGQEYFFRFYDPRVLRNYLPTCTPEETQTFFGLIGTFFAEGREPGELWRFSASPQGVKAARLALPLLHQEEPR